MRSSYPPLERVLSYLNRARPNPAAGEAAIIGATQQSQKPQQVSQTTDGARPPSDLTIIGYENGFPILSWQWSPDDRVSCGGCYGVRYQQIAPGPYGIVVPGAVWVGSPGPAHRTIRDVYGYCIFGGTYEVSVSFVPPEWPASQRCQPIRVVLPEAF
jgi:hypothetical protein